MSNNFRSYYCNSPRIQSLGVLSNLINDFISIICGSAVTWYCHALCEFKYTCTRTSHIGVAWSPCWRDEAHPPRVTSGVCEGWQVDRRRGKPYSLPIPDPLPGRTDSVHRALWAGHWLQLTDRVHDWTGVPAGQLYQHRYTGTYTYFTWETWSAFIILYTTKNIFQTVIFLI